MGKRQLSQEDLERVCQLTFEQARLPISKVCLSVVGNGARSNWELGALWPDPDMETATKALDLIGKIQDAFEIEGDPRPPAQALS